jgi:hypothetical protein
MEEDMTHMLQSIRRPHVASALLSMVLLSGCASTTIVSSNNPSRAQPAAWTDYASLPVQARGVIAGHSKADLLALFPRQYPQQVASLDALPPSIGTRHIVMYFNPAGVPDASALCSGSSAFRRGAQDGKSAHVVAALCDGNTEITRLDARLLTEGLTPAQLTGQFDMLKNQLWQSLTPGNNHPEQLYPGKMFG